jgi:hypothetical protein
MIIPNKYSGYQAGIRLYPMGGGGGGTSLPGTGDSQIGNTGGTTGITGAVIPPASTPFVSVPGMGDSQIGNTGGTTGIMGAVIPPAPPVSVPGMGNSQIGNTGGATGITGAVIPPTQPITQPSTGRPLPGAAQFYQPIYQPQYQNYNMGNPMSVSQYGQQPFFGGFGGFGGGYGGGFGGGYGGGFGGGFDGGYGGGYPDGLYRTQMQSPFSFQPQMNMGMQTPFSSGMSQPAPQRTSSGPAQAIIGRSSQMRGTPNVMRRAEGGIASLMDGE